MNNEIFIPTGIEAAVCADIARRQQGGIAKYGTTVAENPLSLRQWTQHFYEELLDAAVYAKRTIAEIDAREATNKEAPARGAPFDEQLNPGTLLTR